MHEIRCGFNNKEHIVLLHGYGGTSMTFIRIFKDLSARFQVHALDFLGMGLSHRKEYNHESDHLQTITYYVEAIEQWRMALGLSSFVLAGHSFGGYLASCYAKFYPKRVTRLILISPPGVMYMDSQISEQMYNDMRRTATCGRKIFLSIAKSLIGNGTTPSTAMNWFILGNMFMDRILTGRLGLQAEEKDTWKTYMKTVSNIRPNSERGFFKIFYFPKLGCQEPIGKMLTENKFAFPIEFYYGDADWMEKESARALVANNPKGNRLSYFTVEDAGHQIIFDNPRRMAAFILQTA